MASFAGALLRLIFRGKPQEGRTSRMDEEQGVPNAPSTAGFGSAAVASTLGVNQNAIPHGHAHRRYLVSEDDPLTLYRLMVGISTSPYLGYSESSPIGTRPAANIGIYARVIHSEQKSKDRYKVFSILINACYFLQIVVAASLTAMGAAGVSHGAVTAFGAINTIIAGLLTFLKGSGLPARLKYYGNEWKKIREFIEQRERDFSRSNCTLDVFEIVATIDRMYNHTKQEIEMNTPDSYTSVTGGMRFRNGSNEKVGGIDVSKFEGLASKLNGTVQKLAVGLEGKAQDVTNRIHDHEKEISENVRGVQRTVVNRIDEKKESLDREASERTAQAAKALDDGKREVLGSKDQIEQAGTQAVRDASDTHRTVVGEMRAAASASMRGVADRLGHHHDSIQEGGEKK
ncbi:uncharacterized protein F4822DRAFT_39920 [Hypoxylon trugodes]|uniref:uncharacterized protein n=1 Tax=Hypoxylon trugodes TaxID=326681 RepID=UPI0021956CA8|nr:uncharacterized protein F4822DRAFT_39920 [Hypoxylon trugodes]KAI1394180.1 hypothetical protein F4822DRAFT_39920 [Hypoxylon trugodes]